MEESENTYMSPTSVRVNGFENNYQSVGEDAIYMAPTSPKSLDQSGMVDMSEFCRSNTNKPKRIVFAPRPKSNVQVDPKTSPLLKPTHESHLSLRKHFADPNLPQKRGSLSPKSSNEDEMYVEAADAKASPNFQSAKENNSKPIEKVLRKKSILIMQGESEYNSFISLKEDENQPDEYQIPMLRLESVSEDLDSSSTVYLDLCAESDDISSEQAHKESSHAENIDMGGAVSRKKLGLPGKGRGNGGATASSVRMRGNRIQKGDLKVSGTGLPRPISMPFSSPPSPPGPECTNPKSASPPPPPQGAKPQMYTSNNQANPGNRPLPPTPGKHIGSSKNLVPEHQTAARVSSIPEDAPPLPPTQVPALTVAEKPPPLLPKSDKPYIPKLPYRPPSPFLKMSEPESTSSSASSSPTRTFSTSQEISQKPPIPGLKPVSMAKIASAKHPGSPSKPPVDARKPTLKPISPISPRQNSNVGIPLKIHPIAEMIKKGQLENESAKPNHSPAKIRQWPPVSSNKSKNDLTGMSHNTPKKSTSFVHKNTGTNQEESVAKLSDVSNKSPPLPFKPPIGAKGISFNLKPVPLKQKPSTIETKRPEEIQQCTKPQQPNAPKKRAAYSLHKLQAAKLSNSQNESSKPEPTVESAETENVADPNIYSSIECESTPDIRTKPRSLPQSLLANIQSVSMRNPASPAKQGHSVTLNRKLSENLPPSSSNKSATMPRSPITKSRPRPTVPPPPRPITEPPKPPTEASKTSLADKTSSPPIRSPPPSSPLIRTPSHANSSPRSPPPSRPPPPSMVNIQAAKQRQESSRQGVEKRELSSSLHISKSKTTPVKYKPTLSKGRNKSLEIFTNNGKVQEETYQAIPDVSSESNFSTCSEDSEQREGYSPRHQTKKKKKSLSSIVAFTSKIKRKSKQDEVIFEDSPTYMMAMDSHNAIKEPEHFEGLDECIYSGIDDNYSNSNNNSSIYLTSIPSKRAQHTEYTYAELDHTLYDDVTY